MSGIRRIYPSKGSGSARIPAVMAGPLRESDPAAVSDYALVGRIGGGGQGVVYLAREPGGALVAVKILNVTTDIPGVRATFLKEVAASQRVPRFCTAQILDAGISDHRPYIVSEFIDGQSLEAMVSDRGPCSGVALDRVAVATATALGAIHSAGVIHRDFKPSNVIMGTQGPVVIDFGVAAVPGMTTTRVSGEILAGTPAFMAPEYLSAQAITPAADMWAWAVTIIYAATGTLPFPGRGPALAYQIVHAEPEIGDLPDPLRSLVAACLSKDPAGRHSAHEVVQALAGPGVIASGPLAASPASTVPVTQDMPGNPWGRSLPGPTRRRVLTAGLVCAAGAGLGGGLAWDIDGHRTPTARPGRSQSHQPGTRHGPGTLLWQAPMAAIPPAPPLLGAPGPPGALMTSAGVVCVMGKHQVQAFRASNGHPLWTFELPARNLSMMTTTSDAVYIATQSQNFPAPPAPAPPYVLYALRLAVGSTIWQVNGQGELALNEMAVSSGLIYFVIEHQSVISLRACSISNGVEQWRIPLAAGNVIEYLATNDDAVYFTTQDPSSPGFILEARHANSGSPFWSSPIQSGLQQITTGRSTISAAGGSLFVWSSDGTLRWKSEADYAYGPVALSGDVVAAVTNSSELVGLRGSNGKKIWGTPANSQVSPVADGHLIYAGKPGGGLLALNSADAKLEWHSPINFSEGPVVGQNAIYVSDGSKLYALRK